MENPFLLAMALLESRGITTRFLQRTIDNEPAPGTGGEEPINWQLLKATVQPEVCQRRVSAKTVERTRPLGRKHFARGSCV
jgi:hypothetical protein